MFYGLKCKQLILKISWPRGQINRLVRVHRELSGADADFGDSAGDGGGDDDGDDDAVEAEQSEWK